MTASSWPSRRLQDHYGCLPETISYDKAVTYLATFAAQFEGVENADVIIDNVSNDSAAAVNALLRPARPLP